MDKLKLEPTVRKGCGKPSGVNTHRYNNEKPCNKCKETQSARARAYRAKNLERLREQESNYKKANTEKVKIYLSKWLAKNKDKNRGYANKKRALKNNANHSPYKIQDVTDQYGTNCHICKEPVDFSAPRSAGKKGWETSLHLDHVIPLSKGGEDNISNVKPSHALCNLIKGNKS